jgi:hypothetical protein
MWQRERVKEREESERFASSRHKAGGSHYESNSNSLAKLD